MDSEEKVERTLSYIREREKTLSHYSERLRKALNFVDAVFNTQPGRCVLCSYNFEVPGHSLYHNDRDKSHEHLEPIRISVDVLDKEAFFTDEVGNKYFLTFYSSQLLVAAGASREEIYFYKRLFEMPRDVLKALIKSGRTTKFLRWVADELREMGKDYSRAAEAAEKMAAALGRPNEVTTEVTKNEG